MNKVIRKILKIFLILIISIVVIISLMIGFLFVKEKIDDFIFNQNLKTAKGILIIATEWSGWSGGHSSIFDRQIVKTDQKITLKEYPDGSIPLNVINKTLDKIVLEVNAPVEGRTPNTPNVKDKNRSSIISCNGVDITLLKGESAEIRTCSLDGGTIWEITYLGE